MDRFKGLHILVVDDNHLNNQTLKQLLELSGASVTTAENGLEALELLRTCATPFHLMLMDVNMPKLNGLETTRIIRQDEKNSTLPIIALTADSSPQDQWQCFQAGMDAHITKPLDFEILCTNIANVIDGKHNQIDTLADLLYDPTEVESKQEILRRFANNSELIVQMIPLYQQEFQELLAELDCNKYQCNPSESLHALKGLASTLGANEVVRKIIILSDMVKSNTLDKLAFEEAKVELNQAQLNCLDRLRNMFDMSEASDQFQQRQSDSLCLTAEQKQNLIELLKLSDLSVISKIEKIKNHHPKNSYVLELSECINHLKFKEAISLLSINDMTNIQFSRHKSAE